MAGAGTEKPGELYARVRVIELEREREREREAERERTDVTICP